MNIVPKNLCETWKGLKAIKFIGEPAQARGYAVREVIGLSPCVRTRPISEHGHENSA